MKQNIQVILVIGTMLLCTAWLTFQHDLARRDRARLGQDLLEQSWRIQTDLNGIWAHDDSGQSRRLLPTEADPSIRAFLIEAVERQEAMMESLGRISERMDTLEAER